MTRPFGGTFSNTVNEVVNGGGQSGGRGDTTDQPEPYEAIELAGGVAKKCPLQKIENEQVPRRFAFGEGAREEEHRSASWPVQAQREGLFPMVL